MLTSILTYYRDVQRPLAPAEIDENFAGISRRLGVIERLGLQAVSFDTIAWDTDAQTVLFTYTDGRTYGPVPLPQSFFAPRGPWTPGLQYQPRDLVSVAGSMYVCRGTHTAFGFDTDLLAGYWQVVALQGRASIQFQGLYDATKAYAQGDGVVYFPTSNSIPAFYRLSWTPASGVPAGTAPGARDPATGIPYWLPVTTPPQSVDIDLGWPGFLTQNATLLWRYTAVPYTLPANLAGSVIALLQGPANAMSLPIQQLRPNPPQSGQPPSYLVVGQGTLDWAANALVGTATVPALTLLAGDALVVKGPSQFDAQASDLRSAILGSL